MALSFPSAPTNGQIFTAGQSSWTYDGAKWVGSGSGVAVRDEVGFSIGDRVTVLKVAAGLEGMRMPYAMTLSAVRIAVASAPAGAAIVVDVKQNGVSVFTTKPQIAAGAKSSVGGAVPGVVGAGTLADDAEITVDVTQVGATTAGAGLECWLLGVRV